MQVVEAQLEIEHVPEAVGLSLEGFDLVVDALDHAVGDEVLEIVEESCFAGTQGFGYLGQCFDPGLHGIPTPHIEKLHSTLEVILFPEEPELLFHGMSNEKGLIDLEQFVESGFAVGFEVGIVSQKQESVAFERLFAQLVELILLSSPDLIESVIHEGHDVIPVEDDIHVRQPLSHGKAVALAHIHGYCLEFLCFSGKFLNERTDVLLASSFDGMEDPSGFEIREDRHVLMAFPEAELIDPDVPHLSKRDLSVDQRKPVFVDLFHHVPADSKVSGNRPDGAELEKIQHGERKRSDIAVLSVRKGNVRPPAPAALPAFQPVHEQIQKTPLSAHGAQAKKPSFLVLESGLPPTAMGTLDDQSSKPSPDQNAVFNVFRGFVMDAFQPEGVVKYRCGHGLNPPLLFESRQTTRVLSCPHLFCNPGY